MLNGGHYISYACNPNGNWYCYNDSSCREVLSDMNEVPTKLRKTGCTPLSKRKTMHRTLDDDSSEDNSSNNSITTTSTPMDQITAIRKDSVLSSPEANVSEEEKTPRTSESDSNSYKCAYSDVKVPKIDTSSAYILFYERSGLDYKPYLPDVVSNGQIVPEVELDENESELRKQLCSLQ